MPFSPISSFLNLFVWSYGLILIGVDIWLIRRWNEQGRDDERFLYWFLGITALLLLGRFVVQLVSPLFSTRDKKLRPNKLESDEMVLMERPDGSTISMQMRGPKNAPQILLLHGLSTDGSNWYYQQNELQNMFRVITIDWPGFGKSTAPRKTKLTLEKYADDLQAVIKRFDSAPLLVAGHSLGGMILLQYLKMYSSMRPSSLKGVVLVDTTYTNPLKTAFLSTMWTSLQPLLILLTKIQIAIAPIVRLMNYMSYLNGSMHLYVLVSGFSGHQSWQDLDFASRYSFSNSFMSTGKASIAMLDNEALATAQSLTLPVLIMVGENDILTKPQASATLNAAFQESQLHIVNNAAHMSILDQGEEISKRMEDFYLRLNN